MPFLPKRRRTGSLWMSRAVDSARSRRTFQRFSKSSRRREKKSFLFKLDVRADPSVIDVFDVIIMVVKINGERSGADGIRKGYQATLYMTAGRGSSGQSEVAGHRRCVIGEPHPRGHGSLRKSEEHRSSHPHVRFGRLVPVRLLIVWPLRGVPLSLFASVAGRFPSAASRR
jgi:hypothetical protein